MGSESARWSAALANKLVIRFGGINCYHIGAVVFDNLNILTFSDNESHLGMTFDTLNIICATICPPDAYRSLGDLYSTIPWVIYPMELLSGLRDPLKRCRMGAQRG